MSSRRRVALVSGFWGQNIGNAFFNIGGKWLLDQAFCDYDVDFIQDQPGYRTFNRQRKGNPRKDIALLKHLKADVIVLQGPMLSVNFESLWGETFEELTKRGTKIVLLSAGMFQYSNEEIIRNRAFLKRYPPAFIVTRDQPTYDAFGDLAPSYSGIDSAFFVPKAYRPFELTLDPYITVNFDRYPEPNFHVSSEGLPEAPWDRTFEALGYHWGCTSQKLQSRFSNAGQAKAYIGALFDRRKLPARIKGHTVVRPEHRFNPHITWKIYRQPNAVASDEPFTYFTVYAGTSLTLSDRVHACVATLAYGRPAMLFTPTPRQALFDRLGLHDIRKQPVELDQDLLEDERQAELAFVRSQAERL